MIPSTTKPYSMPYSTRIMFFLKGQVVKTNLRPSALGVFLRRKPLIHRVLPPYHLAKGDNELLLVEHGALSCWI
jgi:hypothetical protein